MEIVDLLARMGGLQSMAQELGISQAQATSGAQALIPALLGGFKKQAQAHPAGLEGLGGLLGQLGGGGLLDAVLAPQRTDVNPGNAVLGRIFGSKDVSRTVAEQAAARTGLDPALLMKMLPMLAMMVAGFMAQHGAGAKPASGSGGGGLAGALGGALGSGGGLGGLVGGLLGGSAGGAAPTGQAAGLGSLLDLDGNGNPLDDILRIAGKGLR
jgi:hypothetical protein